MAQAEAQARAQAGGVAARLAGQHVLLTGVTGFVGEALLHLFLTEVPDVRTTVLVRPKGAITGAQRTAKLLGKPIFRQVVEAAGGVEALMAAKVGVLDGDLADVPALPTGIDAVVHCAGDVSFDPPVHEAFTTNVVGTRDLLARVAEVETAQGSPVHYVHVSTAYVAGRRRGHVPEASVEHDVDVAAELAWGLAQKGEVEHRSRTSDKLAELSEAAERTHGRAGMLTASRAAEEARKQWVKDELVRVGTERARSLGWTDCYTFTKALGERVVEAHAAGGRVVSIVRPSIIESALERPYPGWIEGFKMAEPLILAYGRGELPEFPAASDTTIDIVPVDHVVSAIVAVLAHPPAPAEVAYFHVSSGDRNPLTFRVLYEQVRDYFQAHPFAGGPRGTVALPAWKFPGAASVERLLSTSERALKVADYLVDRAPRSARSRSIATGIDKQNARVEFLRRYLTLYQEYAKADLRYSDRRTLALQHSLSPADQAIFTFDTAVVEWAVYLGDIHFPSVTKPVRRLDELRLRREKGRTAGGSELRTVVEGPAAGATPEQGPGESDVVAVFDMDGTLLSSNVVETYLWMRLAELEGTGRLAELARTAARVPGLVRAERKERGALLRAVYREYAGADLAELDAVADELLTAHVLSRLAPEAVRRIREHRRAGHRTVLVTGAVRPLTRPLAPLFDHVEAVDLVTDARGRATGHLVSSPLVGESRAAFLRGYASEHGLDLSRSFAYADSHSDLPLLAEVGNPVAVSPDVALMRHARRHHWTIVDWASPETGRRTLDPAGSAR
ncbi:HAD-IB family hydrolase [Nocardioides bruguierae]|uniref:HAD-IB family hydrolase n=1 Tax=Nocardioides bruguierae TaxID=2945102 RepID=A0A9X2D4T4_9ACTN|nr:HAD-IB family hydrolase [Nocardioides bruguierae]MCM0619422.1 HAD-IB family hydrolase [Nocardioides bruguierae]